MRFVILPDRIEYSNTKGRVIRFPKNAANVMVVYQLVTTYDLFEQAFDDRIQYTEFYT